MAIGYEKLDFSSAIGRREHQEDYISPTPAKAMAAIFDKTLPLSANGADLPPLWHWLYFWSLAFQSELGPEGHEKLGNFLPKVPLPRRMYAGGSCEFIEAIRIGYPAHKESTISNVIFKEGSSGPLFFVTVEHRIIQDEVVKSLEIQNIVYRDMPKSGSRPLSIPLDEVRSSPGKIEFGSAEAPSFSGVWSRTGTIDAESPLLFRFSALTYNAHKIHYDPLWTIGEEGYSQLIVHGPLIAISLLEILRNGYDWPKVRSFSFRSLSPAILGETISLRAHKDQNSGIVTLGAFVGDRAVMAAEAVLDVDI